MTARRMLTTIFTKQREIKRKAAVRMGGGIAQFNSKFQNRR